MYLHDLSFSHCRYNSNADIGLTIGKLESSIQDVQVLLTLCLVPAVTF